MVTVDPIVWAIGVSVLAGVVRAYLGYLSSDKAFNWKEFQLTMITTSLSGLGIAVTLETQISVKDVLLLFLAVMGVDSVRGKVVKT